MMEFNTTVPRDALAVDAAVAAVAEFLREAGVAEQDQFQAGVCLAEALNNVVEHGSAEASRAPMALVCRLEPDWIRFEIVDPAGGPYTLPDPDAVDGLSEGGRGWLIIRGWMQQVELRQESVGTRLLLGMRRSDK